MKNFSQLITEARHADATAMLVQDITAFNNKLKKSLPVDVQKAIYLTAKLNITTADVLDEIRTANKSKLKSLVDKLNVPLEELEDLWNLMKSIKQNYKVMPQYLSVSEREQLEKGILALDDATIDLETKTGREAVARRYTPLVLHIANQMAGKSSLSKSDLISAGMEALTNAMNDWKREPDSKTGRVVSFKTYAGNRIRQQMLNDMDRYSHTLSTGSSFNWYASKKARDGELGVSLDAVSFDALTDIDIDHIGALGAEDMDRNENPMWKKFYAWINKTFTQRDVDIFIRYMGLNGKKEKSKDIAKSYGMSEGNIKNSIINKIIKKIQANSQMMEILGDIFNIYSESLLRGMVGADREQILEVLANDDVYIMLEGVNRFTTKDSFKKYYDWALQSLTPDEQDTVAQALHGGFDMIDQTVKRNRDTYKRFLQTIDPTNRRYTTDGDIIFNMMAIAEWVTKYGL